MTQTEPSAQGERGDRGNGPTGDTPGPRPDRRALIQNIRLAALGILFLAGAFAIVAYDAIAPSGSVTLAVGDVAPDDIRAPYGITYQSEVLTRLARREASARVGNVYDPPNPAILRQQIQVARRVLDYINNIRLDSFGTPDQKLADLEAIDAISLPRDVYARLLQLSDTDWRDVDSQVMLLLERTMRNEIREDDLLQTYANLPNLVSITLDENESALIVALVRALIQPNAFYNETATQAAQRDAAESVQPVMVTFVEGQIVVPGGTIVSERDIEALAQFRLLQPVDQRLRTFAGAALAVLLFSTFIVAYLRQFKPALLENTPLVILIGGLLLIFLAGARIFSEGPPVIAHLYPAAAFTLIVVAITDAHVAMVLTASLAILIGVVTGNSLEPAVLAAATGAAGVLVLGRVERLNAYFVAGLVIGVVNVVIGLIFNLTATVIDPAAILATVPSGFLSGILAAGLGLVGLYLGSSLLNLPTSVKLLELAQPNQPLLQRLLREAPGTYQHSLQVANLAELAAERIGANALLVRIGALYHDIGKLTAPPFFGENQPEGFNPHEQFSPEESARIIISHVTEGERIGRQHRLPRPLIDFILEHHGTTQALYFYNQALANAGGDESGVDKAAYTYPGPRPQNRESGILMLADAAETIVRSKRTRNKQEIADIVADVINMRLAGGQLDESKLTVSDLKVVREVFMTSLQGVFHPRIAYPAPPSTLTQEAARIAAQDVNAPPPLSNPAALAEPPSKPVAPPVGPVGPRVPASEGQS
ncbi:MAG: HDIG domain-containing protein [Anaerolineae bacterium]|nr:HDIG domain-containing protein [Anaerolineae bacterium]